MVILVFSEPLENDRNVTRRFIRFFMKLIKAIDMENKSSRYVHRNDVSKKVPRAKEYPIALNSETIIQLSNVKVVRRLVCLYDGVDTLRNGR